MTAAFEKQEYRSRVAKLRKLMSKRGMDVMLAMSEANMCYLTGYEGFSEYVPQLAMVFVDEEDPYLVIREMDLLCAYPTSYLDHSHILSYPEKNIGSKERTPWDAMAEIVGAKARGKRIGVEYAGKMYGVKAHATMSRVLGADRFVDGDGLISLLKRIKSPAEIEYMQQAGRIVDKAMQAGVLEINVGVREADVAATVVHHLYSGLPGYAGWPTQPPTMAVGKISNAPHLKWTDAKYEWNSQTNFEIGAFRHRYVCPLSRTVYLGDPPARLRHIHNAVTEGFNAAFDTFRPGKTCGDVDRAFRKAFVPHGVKKASRIGYSIGLDWSDGGASIQDDDTTVLEPNMTLHLIIGIWEPNEGYILSEGIRVTPEGAKSFSQMTREMLVKN